MKSMIDCSRDPDSDVSCKKKKNQLVLKKKKVLAIYHEIYTFHRRNQISEDINLWNGTFVSATRPVWLKQ